MTIKTTTIRKINGLDKLIEILADEEIPRDFCLKDAKAIRKYIEDKIEKDSKKMGGDLAYYMDIREIL